MSNWKFYNPDEDRVRLNKALSDNKVADAFHNATYNYLCNELGENDGAADKYIRELFLKNDLLLPQDAYMGDMLGMWYTEGGIRPRKWHKYLCSYACHFMVEGYLALAEKLFPKDNWVTIRGKDHSAVICFEKKVIFDLFYYAINMAPEEALEMIHFTEALRRLKHPA